MQLISLLSPRLKPVLVHPFILFPPSFASHKLLSVFHFQSYIHMMSILVLVPSEDQHYVYVKYSL